MTAGLRLPTPKPAVREIPGYIYDQEKKKYFKIQHPSSSNAAYSSHDAKRLKLSNDRNKVEEEALEKQHGRIKKSTAMEAFSVGGLLSRSFGRNVLDASQTFAGGLAFEGYLKHDWLDRNTIFAIDLNPERMNQNRDIWTVTSQGTAMLPVQLDKNKSTKRKACTSRFYNPLATGTDREINVFNGTFNGSTIREYGNEMATATSISINNSIGQVAMTWLRGGTYNQGVQICEVNKTRPGWEASNRIVEQTIHIPRQGQRDAKDFLSSTAAPVSSSLRFAFGTTDGLLTLNNSTSHLEMIPRAKVKDTFALDFLDQNTLLSGGRKGKLHIIDLRNPRFDNAADVIHHSSSITHIRHLDEYRVLVAGLDTAFAPMCQYDLRFIKQDTFPMASEILPTTIPATQSSRPRGKLKTRSIIEYPDYYNPETCIIGFDIDLESGIIAAAQPYREDYYEWVQLFSLKGGYKLQCKALDIFGREQRLLRQKSEAYRPSSCVRFARDVEGCAKSLWVSTPHGLERFTWGRDRDAQLAG